MDYTSPVTATAAQHIANIEMIAKDYVKNESIKMIFENLNILQECKETIESLKKFPAGQMLTLEWWEGFEGFKIYTEGK